MFISFNLKLPYVLTHIPVTALASYFGSLSICHKSLNGQLLLFSVDNSRLFMLAYYYKEISILNAPLKRTYKEISILNAPLKRIYKEISILNAPPKRTLFYELHPFIDFSVNILCAFLLNCAVHVFHAEFRISFQHFDRT